MILQASWPFYFRFAAGYRGVLVLMTLIGLSYVGFSGNSDSKDEIDISINFRTLRKLEYQVWVSQNFPDEYQDLDDLDGNLIGRSGTEDLLIRALPFAFNSIGGKLSYKVESASGSLRGFLIAESERSQTMFQANQGQWKTLFLNGQNQGRYLYVVDLPELNNLYE